MLEIETGLAWEDGFEALEEKILLAAQPVVSVSADPQPLIGSNASIHVGFSNAAPGGGANDVGFAPYVDLVLPQNGADGAGQGNTPQNDGVTFSSATYLGQQVDATVLEFDASGHATHPFARDASGQLITVNAADFGAGPGDQLVVLRLPYGSFSPGQTPADITVNFHVSDFADVNTALPVSARGGFAYGTDGLNNPTADPTVLGPIDSGTVTPVLGTIDKVYNFREQETASGPSFPRAWTVEVDIAPGQTLTNYVLTDKLPDGIVVLGASITSGQAGSVVVDPTTNTVTATFTDPIVGGVGVDARMRIDFYVGEYLTPGQPLAPVIDPVTGAPHALANNASGTGTWVPLDPRDAPQVVSFDPPGPEDVITAKAFEVEKSTALVVDRAAAGLGPLDTLQYALDFQVSDYFNIGSATFTDVLSDGVAFDSSFAPTLTIALGPNAGTHTFDASNFSFSRNPVTGQTTLTFDVAALLGGSGVLSGATVGQIVYRSTVEGAYASGGSVHEGDTLSNSVLIDGDIVDNSGNPTGGHVQDDSHSAVTLASGTFDKSVYAKNGTLVTPGTDVVVAAGDLVTYRLRLALPQTLAAAIAFNDFLPLPVFSVQGVTFTFDDTVSSAAPGENVVKWGPDAAIFDALYAGNPILGTLPDSNALTIRFGDTVGTAPVASVVDLLFTVRAQDKPFGDGLLLSNLATSFEYNSHNQAVVISDIAQIVLAEPELHISKGVVGVQTGQTEFATSFSRPIGPVSFAPLGSTGTPFSGIIDSAALAATPVDADLSGVDAGDLVRFAITVENVGGGPKGAHDILIRDTLPPGFVIPPGGLNLTVYRGDGTVIPYVLEGTGLFDPNGGLRLLDPSNADPTDLRGALDPAGTGSGNNIAVIVYDLRVADNAGIANAVATNVARIEFYAAQENGAQFADNLLPDQRQDDANVTTGSLGIDKVLTSTSLAESTGSSLLIGEEATFTITATMREGVTLGVVLSDVLPTVPGLLSFVSARVVSVGGNLSFTGTTPVAGQSLPDSGGGFALALGTVTNIADNAVTGADRIVIEITGLVANVPQNNGGDVLTNQAALAWTDPDATPRTIVDTASVTVIEPAPNIDKVANVSTADGGDIITYTLTITNPAAGGASATAYDAVITDLLSDPTLALVAGSVAVGGSLAGTATIVTGNHAGDSIIRVTVPAIGVNQTLIVTYQAHVDNAVETGRVIRNTGLLDSDSAPGNVPDQRQYHDLDDATVTVRLPGISKTVIATSLPDTGASQGNAALQDVAFGEDVTYRVTLRFAEGTTPTASFVDQSLLNGGMRAVSVNVASIGANLSLPGAGTPLLVDTNGDSIADTVRWSLGTVSNTPDGVANAQDTIVLDIVYRLRDVPSLHAGSTVVNNAALNWVSTTSGARAVQAQASFEVVAPVLTLTKSPDVQFADAGDVITYTVTATNRGGAFQAPAYDLTFDDTLIDPGLDLVAGSVTVAGVTGAVVATGNNPGDGTIRITLPKLDPGAVAVITYRATVNISVVSGQQVHNTVSETASTYPGITYGVPSDGERVFTNSAHAVVNVDVSSEQKTVVSTSLPETGDSEFRAGVPDAAIGETVTYAIRIQLAEGTTVLGLVDQLPAGAGWMEYLSYTIQPLAVNTNLSFIPGSETATPSDRSGDGILDTLTIDFGTVLNTPDGVDDDRDAITIHVVARVIDRMPENVAGRSLTNTAIVLLSGTPQPAVTADVDVVEPDLRIVKTPDIATGDAGDIVTYTIQISPAPGMSGPAYGVSLDDLLGPKLSLLAGSVTASAGTIVTGNAPGDTAIHLALPTLLPSTGAITVTYQARLTDSVAPNELLTNTAVLDYRSAPDAAVARNYTDTDTADVLVRLPQAHTKQVVGTSVPLANDNAGDPNVPDAAVGALITYTITAHIGEGTQHVIIDELPPAGGTLLIEQALVSFIGANISGSLLHVGDAGVATASGMRFDFGTVVNAGDNVTDANDEIVITLHARVANVPANVAGAQVINHSALIVGSPYGPPTTTTAQAAVDVVTPILHITKQATPAAGDAGDEITYTVSLFNDAAATGPAFDVMLADLVPAGMSLVVGSVTASRGTIVSGNGAGDTSVRVTLGQDRIDVVDLPQTPWDDRRLDVTYRLVFNDTVEHGQAITNTASYTANSAPAADANGQARGYAGSAAATVNVAMPIDLTKTIIATSLPQTGASQLNPSLPDLAVGEAVTYRLTATVAEGTQQLVIVDTLAAGLAYESGSIVSVGSGLPAALHGMTPSVAGQVLTFNLGTVVNTGDNDATNDFVIIEVVARVRDIPGNVAGTVLTNGATLTATPPTAGAPVQTDAAQASAEVVTPNLVIDKTILGTATGDAGDEITYQVTLANVAATGPAFDVVLTDLVPAGMSLVAGSVTATRGTVVSGNGAGDATLRVELGNAAILAVDDPSTAVDETSVTLTYRLAFNNTVENGQTITNTASFTANTAPAAGANGQERPLSGSDAATVTVNMPVALAKTIVATSLPETGAGQFNAAITDAAIGETITYRVTATVAEGTQQLVIVDTLAAGLVYESGSIVSVGSGLPAALHGLTPSVAGQVLTFNLGTVVNTGDNDATNDFVIIEVVARVRDIPANVAGTVLTNDAVLTATPPTAGTPAQTADAQVDAEVVTPVLVLDKTAPAGFAYDGEIVTYTVTVQHAGTSTAAAFDLLITDLLSDPNLTLVPGTVTTTLGTIEAGNATGDGTVAVRIPVLGLGQSVTVTFQAQVASNAPPTNFNNTATGDFTTAPPGEGGRPGQVTDTEVVSPAPDFTKEVAGTSLGETGTGAFNPSVTDLTIGETVTYRLTTVLPQGLTENITLTDLMPAGLVPLAARIVSVGSGLTISGTPTIVISGQNVTLSFGDILNGSGAVVDAADTLVVEIDAVLTDQPAVTAGATLVNAATLDFTIDTRAGALNGTAPVEVVEPGFTLAKAVDHTTGDAGDSFLYTITLTPNADATGPAYLVRITDAPPAPMVLDPASVTASAGTVGVVNGQIVLTLPVVMPDDAPVVITYRASLADAVEHGQLVTNTASVAYASAPTTPNRPGGESASATVQGTLPIALDKQIVATSLPETGSAFFDPARPDIAAGEVVTYRLVATVAEGTQRLVLTDALPPGLTADAVRVVALGAGITAGAPVIVVAGQSVSVDFGTIVNAGDNVVDAGDRIVIEIDARLLPGVAPGTTLTNTAALTSTSPSDPSVPAQTANAAAAADAVQAELAIDKQVNASFATVGETVGYTITVTQTGNSTAPVYGLVIADPLSEPAMQLVAGSVTTSTGQVVIGNGSGDGTVSVLIPVLMPGQSVTITFQVQFVSVPIPAGVATNTALFTATSAPGAAGDPILTTFTGSDDALLPVSSAASPLGGGLLAEFDEVFRRIGRNAIIVPHALSGTAAPGSVVTLAILDSTEAPATVTGRTADMGGNWMAAVPVVAGDLPLPDEVAFVAVAQAAGRAAAAGGGAVAAAGSTVGESIFAPAAVQPAALDLPRTVLATVTDPAFTGFNSPADGLRLSFGGTVGAAGFFTPRGGGVLGSGGDGGLAQSVAALAAPNSLALNSFAQSFIASLNAASSTSR